jgi:lipopolysaccharide transport system ATP-binding protein
MSDTAIAVDNLSKSYLVGHRSASGQSYTALRDVIGREVCTFARKTADFVRGRQIVQGDTVEEFWALKDVSFEVRHGEVLGIVGPNGAGKSTMLKVLSRITEPTRGLIKIRGRIGSLLEIGTGFHPEMTGRENIFLSGAILGMTKADIRRTFHEIVAFAGVEKFLDTPVKRYSSGMYVRLAFAVATHLEVDILIVDEVLAVGDAEFQKKCLGKLTDARKSGRTVLFVSHNMSAVRKLCTKAIWLQNGRINGIGSVEECTAKYLSEATRRGTLPSAFRLDQALDLRRFELSQNPVPSGSQVRLSLEIAAQQATRIDELAVLVHSSSGVRVSIVDVRSFGLPVSLRAGQTLAVACGVAAVPLTESEYQIGLCIRADHLVANFPDLITLSVMPRSNAGHHVPYPAADRGFVEFDVVDKVLLTVNSQ